MNYKIERRSDIRQPKRLLDYVATCAFVGNSMAHEWSVEVFDNGEVYNLVGTISGYAVLANGSTVALTGSSSGNKAVIVLPSGVYSQAGSVRLVMVLTGSDDSVTALDAIYITVAPGETDEIIDPGTVIPSVTALIADIEAAVNSIPESYTELLAAIAPTFDVEDDYTVGEYCWHSTLDVHKLYKFTANHSAGNWTGTDVVEVSLASEVTALESTLNNTVYTTKSKNLFDPNAASIGKYLNLNGTIEDYASTAVSDFIPVEVSKYVTVSKNTSSGRAALSCNTLLFYDSSKAVIVNSGAAWVSSKVVPSGAAYVRITYGKTNEDVQVELTADGTFTDYVPYELSYHLDTDIVIPANQVDGITNAIEKVAVKGTNLVTASNSGSGGYYYTGSAITYISDSTYKYTIVSIKPNTIYYTNVNARWWILTTDDDTVVSYGNSSMGGRCFNSGNATKLYYSVYESAYNAGLIIAEGYAGVLSNVSKPEFVSGINQLMQDSWFAVALPQDRLRFTVGINEKLYYKNILALENNTIKLWAVANEQTFEDDGVSVEPETVTTDSNIYGYWAYDDNLSLVAQLVRGQTALSRVYADSVNSCSALIIGDSIVARNGGKIGQTMLDAFTARSKTLTLLGTLGTGDNKHEGRAGWSTSDYFTDKQYEGVTNPFYNPTSETFDFSYYMTNQEYNSVDYVIIHLGGNDLYSVDFADARARIEQTKENICAMIDSILSWNANQKIIICLAPTISSDSSHISKVDQKLVRAKFANYNAEALVLLTKYANVRCSNDYMILDPATDLADHIHPTNDGLAKIGMELVSQINCWQQDEAAT